MTVDEMYQFLEKMSHVEHMEAQRIGDPILREALREVAQQIGERFGPVKQRFLAGDLPTILAALAIVEIGNPGRFDAFAYCDKCHKFTLHEYDGPANVDLGIAGHWPAFLELDT